MNLLIIPLAVVATLMGAIGATFLKKGGSSFSINPIKLIKNYNMIAGLALYVISSIVFISALKMGELSTVYPMTSLSYIWVSIISFKFLKEKSTSAKWTGMGLIIFGVVLMTLA